jgi:hypothetical protein
MAEVLYEKDLYIPIRDYFINKGFEVRSEVNHCDVCALKDGQVVVIELKKNLSVDLLAQGVKRQKIADLVYIAVPKPKKFTKSSKWKDIYHLLRRLELGLILVSFKGKTSFVEIAVQPEIFDRTKSIQSNKRRKTKLIEEFKGRAEDLNIGGSTREKLMTAYRESSLYIVYCIDKLGPLSSAKLKKCGTDEKKTYSILYNNHYGWFYRMDKGVYDLTDKGKEALKTYEKLSEVLEEKFYKNNSEMTNI